MKEGWVGLKVVVIDKSGFTVFRKWKKNKLFVIFEWEAEEPFSQIHQLMWIFKLVTGWLKTHSSVKKTPNG